MAGKVLVVGANGNVGRPLVAALLAKGEQVKAASRSGGAGRGRGGRRIRYRRPRHVRAGLRGRGSCVPDAADRHHRRQGAAGPADRGGGRAQGEGGPAERVRRAGRRQHSLSPGGDRAGEGGRAFRDPAAQLVRGQFPPVLEGGHRSRRHRRAGRRGPVELHRRARHRRERGGGPHQPRLRRQGVQPHGPRGARLCRCGRGSSPACSAAALSIRRSTTTPSSPC